MSASVTLSRWMVLAALAMLLGPIAAAQAKKAVVTMRDGRVIEGEVVRETPESLTLDIQGIETTLPRKDITKTQFKLSLADEYKQKKAKIKPEQVGDWYGLARWLYNQDNAEADNLARQELAALLKVHTDYQAAKILLQVVEQRIADRSKPIDGTTDPNNDTTTTGTGTPTPKPGDGPQPMTKLQTQLLKVYEVDLGTKPSVVVPTSVVDQFFQSYRDSDTLKAFQGVAGKQRFKRLEGYEQLRYIFQERARELYGQVLVRDEPTSLRTFRTKINPVYLTRYCGACHGKAETKKFYLFTNQPSSEQTAYSNWLILNRYKPGAGPFIDYAQPGASVLVQYGLPGREARTPHPEVPGRRPYFTGLKDRRIQMLTDWITNDLKRVTPPNYPIEYAIPTRGPKAPKPEAPAPEPAAPAKAD